MSLQALKLPKNSLLEEYAKIQIQYEELLGDNTIVLMEKGKLYEAYQWNMNGVNVGKAKQMSEILRYRLASVDNSKPHSPKNPYMTGCNGTTIESTCDILSRNGYSIVLVEQGKNTDKFGRKERKVTKIISYGTNIDRDLNNDTLSCTVAFIHINVLSGSSKKHINPEEIKIECGMSYMDISTGYTEIWYRFSSDRVPTFALRELNRFLTNIKPVELLVHVTGENMVDDFVNMLRKKLSQVSLGSCTVRVNADVIKDYENFSFQDLTINRIFSCKFDVLGLPIESRSAAISFIGLLCSYERYNSDIVSKIRKPIINHESTSLLLFNDATAQLSLVDGKASLYGVLNKLCTSQGKRLLRKTLLQPFISEEIMTEYYDAIQLFIDDVELLSNVRKLLNTIPDLEKIARKIQLGKITPMELGNVIKKGQGYDSAFELVNVLKPTKLLNTSSLKTLNLDVLYNGFLTAMNTEVLSTAIIRDEKVLSDGLIFNRMETRKYAQLKFSYKKYKKSVDKLNEEKLKIEKYMKHGKIEIIDGRLRITSGRWNKVKKTFPGIRGYPTVAKKVLLHSDLLDQLKSNIDSHGNTFQSLQYEMYMDILYSQNEKSLSDVSKFTALVDYLSNGAFVSVKYDYRRPMFTSDNVIETKSLRHPIIERLISDEYVQNDVCLSNEKCGMLLYGPNSVGKTSLIRAIGLNVIMAQCGYYTSCHLKFKPRKTLLVRLSGNDRMSEGHSSFVVEMLDASNILNIANSESLVLGDELCKGTETRSGTAIAVPIIEHMASENVLFAMATHLHDLPTLFMDEISKRIQVCHLSVNFVGELKFDRILKSGRGSDLYGIEIASVYLPKNIIRRARELRDAQTDRTRTKKSNYNAKVFVQECSVCGKRKDLETDHIIPKSLSDKNGFVKFGVFKHHISNLSIKCKSCHLVKTKLDKKISYQKS